MKHPNIIKFQDCFYTDDYVMIAMEYATSGNLAEYLYQKCPKIIKEQVCKINKSTAQELNLQPIAERYSSGPMTCVFVMSTAPQWVYTKY